MVSVAAMSELDYRFCFEKGMKFFKEGKLFEARSYLKRAYLIWPWDTKLKELLDEIEKNVNKKSKRRGEESHAGDKTRDGLEI